MSADREVRALAVRESVARLMNAILAWLGDERPQWIYLHEVLSACGLVSATDELHLAVRKVGYSTRIEEAPAGDGTLPAFARLDGKVLRPNTVAATKEQLRGLVPQAVRTVQKAMRTAARCPTCGGFADPRNGAVAVKAAITVLDRTGHGPSQKVELEASVPGWARYLTEEQLETVAGWIDEAKERAAREGAAE